MATREIIIVTAKELGDRLRSLRKALNLNQADVAEKAGMKQPNLSDWEMGVLPEALLNFGNLALVLGETPDSLLLTTQAAAARAIPDALRDNLASISKALEKADAEATRHGEGPLPSTIVKQFIDDLNVLLKLQPGEPGATERATSTLLPPVAEYQKAHRELVMAARQMKGDNSLTKAVERAEELLSKTCQTLAPSGHPLSPKDSGASALKIGPHAGTPKPKKRYRT